MSPRPRLSSQQKAIRKGSGLADKASDPSSRRPLYTIHPGPQLAFMQTSAEEVLYGGAAGGGKSLALRAWGVDYCMRYPGAVVMLFRRTYRELEDTHILEMQKEIPLSIATYASGSHNLIFNNGSMIKFRFCDHEEDVRCVGVDTPILKADLCWVRAGDLRVGDELLGFDEYSPGQCRRRKLRRAVVMSHQVKKATVHRIHLADGTFVDATPEHRWLVRTGKGILWRSTSELFLDVNRPGPLRLRRASLRRVMPSFVADRTFEGGFLSGAFDGEGCLSWAGQQSRSSRSLSLQFTQKNNALLGEVERLLTVKGFRLGKNRHRSTSDVSFLRIGSVSQVVRFLGTFRPPRLLEKFAVLLSGMSLPCLEDVLITAIDPLEVRPIASMSTDCSTYIANGYAAHNTYDTAEFDALLIDEITHFTLFMYQYLVSRVRSTKLWWPGRRIRLAGTPLGVGHVWVQDRFITSAPYGAVWQSPEEEGGFTRQFIPAKVTDNLTLMKRDPNYIRTLHALPREERQAKLYGDWSTFSGQFFGRWDGNVHLIEPFDIPPDWDRWICVDYGFNAPYACEWVARPPGTLAAFVYREHYATGVDLDEQVYRAKQATTDAAEKLKAVVLDPSLFNKVNVKGQQVRPMADHWRDAFGGMTNVIRGNNERVAGWRLIREMLEWSRAPDGRVLIPPRLYVFNTCSNLARTLPLLQTDKNNQEDVDSNGEDHAPDALRYGLVYAFEGSGRNNTARRYYIGPQGVYTGPLSPYNAGSRKDPLFGRGG